MHLSTLSIIKRVETSNSDAFIYYTIENLYYARMDEANWGKVPEFLLEIIKLLASLEGAEKHLKNVLG